MAGVLVGKAGGMSKQTTSPFPSSQSEADAILAFLERSEFPGELLPTDRLKNAMFKSDGYKMAIELRLLVFRRVIAHKS